MKKMEQATGFGGGRNKAFEKQRSPSASSSYVLSGSDDAKSEAELDSENPAGVEGERHVAGPHGSGKR